MNKQELEETLLKYKVPKELYSLSGGLPSEAYCMERQTDKWQVYYSERGIKTNIGYFESEEEACNCLLMEIKKVLQSING